MTTSIVLSALDKSIARAVRVRDVSTAAWAHTPSAANYLICQRAQAKLDGLLDERFSAQ